MAKDVEYEIRHMMLNYKHSRFTFDLRTYIMALPKHKVKIAVEVLNRLVIDGHIPTRILLLVTDLMAYRFKVPEEVPVNPSCMKKDTNNCYIKVLFHNKGMDLIDLPEILNKKEVLETIPKHLRGSTPVVSYRYRRTIAGRVFNCRKVVDDLDMDRGTVGMTCNCGSSKYRYEPCGHVVTGDLGIIRDVKLRNLLRKGPMYREQNNINWNVNLKSCKEAVSSYVRKWAKRVNVDVRVLRDWEQTVHKCIAMKVKVLKQRHINKRKQHVLRNRVHVNSLNNLHEEYVLVPADKASNNIIVVCKKYYLEIIMKELSQTSTYEEENDDSASLVSRHLEYMMNNEIVVHSEQERLPSFYWLPKLHKTPYGTRFIAASNKCTTKQLSSILTSCFKTIIKHFKEYCEGIYRFTGVNCFWIIENSLEVLDKLQSINTTSRARSFESFDFATLYTNIPHNALKEKVKLLVNEAYRVRGAMYLIVDRCGTAHWSATPSDKDTCISVSESRLMEWTEYLIDNIFIEVGNKVYRQTIGIPMGTDCAPQLANMFLMQYELTYMKKLMKENLHMAKRFSSTVRYIDDLLTLNNTMFENEVCNIYPPELTLKKTTECETNLSYLDISISICDGKYVTEVFDKRDDYNFDIVNFPYMCSNIPAKPTYGVYMSQLIKIARICDNYSSFIKRHKLLTSRLIKQGFWYSRLVMYFKRFAKRYGALFSKYGVGVRRHVHDGICVPLEIRHDLVRNVVTRRHTVYNSTIDRSDL